MLRNDTTSTVIYLYAVQQQLYSKSIKMASNNANNEGEFRNEETHPNEQPLNEELPNEQVSLPQEQSLNEQVPQDQSLNEQLVQEPPPNEQFSSSPDIVFDEETCPVCLGPHVNKSRPICGHVFCYQCLVDWSRIKLECPLCKQGFTSFKHSFQSPDDFQVYTPPPVAGVAEDPLGELFILLNPQPNLMALLDAHEEFHIAFYTAILRSILETANRQ